MSSEPLVKVAAWVAALGGLVGAVFAVLTAFGLPVTATQAAAVAGLFAAVAAGITAAIGRKRVSPAASTFGAAGANRTDETVERVSQAMKAAIPVALAGGEDDPPYESVRACGAIKRKGTDGWLSCGQPWGHKGAHWIEQGDANEPKTLCGAFIEISPDREWMLCTRRAGHAPEGQHSGPCGPWLRDE